MLLTFFFARIIAIVAGTAAIALLLSAAYSWLQQSVLRSAEARGKPCPPQQIPKIDAVLQLEDALQAAGVSAPERQKLLAPVVHTLLWRAAPTSPKAGDA